jgi:hypothetical protein
VTVEPFTAPAVTLSLSDWEPIARSARGWWVHGGEPQFRGPAEIAYLTLSGDDGPPVWGTAFVGLVAAACPRASAGTTLVPEAFAVAVAGMVEMRGPLGAALIGTTPMFAHSVIETAEIDEAKEFAVRWVRQLSPALYAQMRQAR